MREAVVYSRAGCHLCERLIESLVPLLRDRCRLEVRDVDSRADWRRHFGERVPVLEIDGRHVCECHLDPHAVEQALSQS